MMKKMNLFKVMAYIAIVSLMACEEELPPPPEASFYAMATTIMVGETTMFFDLSTNSPEQWEWSFSGGSPSSSNVQNPVVKYYDSGEYSVSLRVSNSGGEDYIIEYSYIVVNPEPPEADFSVSDKYIDTGDEVYFTDESTNSPTSWLWIFDGGTPMTSSEQNPSVTYETAGTYEVRLKATNESGDDVEIKTGYIVVEQSTVDFTIYNPIFTDIIITVNSETKTIPPGGSVTYYDFDPYDYISYYAYTSGETGGGSQVGLMLEWGNSFYMDSDDLDLNLVVSDDYFFIYMTNTGSTLGPVYVNYGLSSQTVDYISIPNDGQKYRIGYYKAYTNGNVRAYNAYNSSQYVYWNYGNQYTLSWTNNQSVSLLNDVVKGESIILNDKLNNIHHLVPEHETNYVLNIPEKATTHYAKEAE